MHGPLLLSLCWVLFGRWSMIGPFNANQKILLIELEYPSEKIIMWTVHGDLMNSCLHKFCFLKNSLLHLSYVSINSWALEELWIPTVGPLHLIFKKSLFSLTFILKNILLCRVLLQWCWEIIGCFLTIRRKNINETVFFSHPVLYSLP